MTINVSIGGYGEVPSKPRAGRSLAGAVAPSGRLVLDAVEKLRAIAPTVPLSWIAEGSGRDRETADETIRKAWALAAVGLIVAIDRKMPVELAGALRWFGDSASASALHDADVGEVEAQLSIVASDPTSKDLLPYILDSFGATSRLDVLRDGSRRADRAARKEVGSFYTPSDVADFMVESIAGPTPEDAVWLDPACGSGVFLLAVLRCLERRGKSAAEVAKFATTNLCGLDLSPLATDFAAFSLVSYVGSFLELSPAETWVKLRANLVAVNALEVTARSESRNGSLSIAELFGSIEGNLKIVCNPPYTQSGQFPARRHWDSLRSGRRSTSLCLPFVEMGWKFDGLPGDAAAFVVPLSVTTNRSSDHAALRDALSKAGGDWTLLFFDRQPHALFGEDAKTRNVIMFRRHAADFSVKTSRMLKWTSRQRSSIFSEDRAVELGSTAIRRLVPKLGTEVEVSLYRQITSYNLRSSTRPELTSIATADIADGATERDVFVGSTAYNFLNVFRTYPDPRTVGGTFSASKVHRLRFADADLAKVGFALLSSPVAFWLWHVECDGFHVPAWFLEDLPLFDLTFPKADLAQLSKLGGEVWENSRGNMIASLNGGKRTFSFRPSTGCPARSSVDAILHALIGGDAASRDALASFEEATIKIDGLDRAMRAGDLESRLLRMMSK